MKMQYRQGDVLIERVEDLAAQKETTEDRLLVRGEGRYHGHFLTGEAEIYRNPDFSAENTVSHYLDVKEEARIQHLHTETRQATREHREVILPPGRYRVIRQREYNPYARAIEILQD